MYENDRGLVTFVDYTHAYIYVLKYYIFSSYIHRPKYFMIFFDNQLKMDLNYYSR